jgi:hypothetical protein
VGAITVVWSLPMDEFVRSNDAASEYPKNLVCHRNHQHVLDAYVDQVNERAVRLFCRPDRAAVNFLQLDDESRGGRLSNILEYSEP